METFPSVIAGADRRNIMYTLFCYGTCTTVYMYRNVLYYLFQVYTMYTDVYTAGCFITFSSLIGCPNGRHDIQHTT